MFSVTYVAGTSLFVEREAFEVHQHLSEWRLATQMKAVFSSHHIALNQVLFILKLLIR
jgi:hypothetical protein